MAYGCTYIIHYFSGAPRGEFVYKNYQDKAYVRTIAWKKNDGNK